MQSVTPAVSFRIPTTMGRSSLNFGRSRTVCLYQVQHLETGQPLVPDGLCIRRKEIILHHEAPPPNQDAGSAA